MPSSLLFETIGIIIAGFGGGYIGLWLHEGTHYSLGELFGAEPRMLFKPYLIPRAVDFDNPSNMTDIQLRLTGGATVVWPLILIIVFLNVQHPNSPIEVLILFTPLGASAVSPSDLLAMILPSEWRMLNDRENAVSHIGAMQHLLQEI